MTDLSSLAPSTRLGQIPVEVLRSHSPRGVYLGNITGSSQPLRILRWSAISDEVLIEEVGCQREPQWWLPTWGEWFYLKAQPVSFQMTIEQMRSIGDQPSGRAKSVTRRRNVPRWAKPGRLFNAWSGSFRNGRPDYLGTFEVVSAEMRTRYGCYQCFGIASGSSGPGRAVQCAPCGWTWNGDAGGLGRDTLTPDELTREGFPEMTGDEFWSLLVKSGNVDDEGRACRLEFKEVA